MALTLNLVVVPALVGLLAGTGAVATYVSNSAASAPIPAVTQEAQAQPCTAQTWPYIDSRCLTRAPQKPVRVVMAPRGDDAAETVMRDAPEVPSIPAPQSAIDRATAALPPGMITSDGVLRQPAALPAPKARAKRSEQRRWVARSYQVPAEAGDRSARPILVVRPLRIAPSR